MSHTAKLTIKYESKIDYMGSYYGDDVLPEEYITMEIPAEDLSTMQLFRFFSNFLRSIGHNDYGIMKGACNIAFNEMNNEDDMKRLATEFDLVMEEHIQARLGLSEQRAEEWEKQYWNVRHNTQKEINKLRAEISRLKNPDNVNYTEEEMNAMCSDAEDQESCKEMAARELEWAGSPSYDDMIASGYEMTGEGFWIPGDNMKVTTNDPMLAWDGLIPGSDEAVKKGCKCPVMDNAEMPDDRKWVNGDCPLHGKAK